MDKAALIAGAFGGSPPVVPGGDVPAPPPTAVPRPDLDAYLQQQAKNYPDVAPAFKQTPSATPAAQVPVTTTVDPETGQVVPYLTFPTQQYAPVAPPAAGQIGAPSQVAPAPSRPALNLDTMMQGVWQTESRNRQHDAEGRIVRSSAGALGVSQLMPGTAASLGVDPFDETQNREGGKRYLAQQFEKYGNWEDALAAYNWGPGSVDKWIAKGRDPAAMPSETRAYIKHVFGNVGGDPASVAAEPTGSPKSQMIAAVFGSADAAQTAGGVQAADAGGTKFAEQSRRDLGRTAMDFAIAPMQTILEQVGVLPGNEGREGRGQDFAFGALREASRLVTGTVQAGLQLAAPSVATEFTNFANESEDRLRRLIGASKDDKWTTTAGGLTGTTLAILGSAGALGTTAPAAWLTNNVPMVARMIGSGTALGATQFHDKPGERSRVLEGAIGGTVGLLGAGVVKALQGAAQYASRRGEYDSFVGLLRKNTEDLTPSTTRLRDLFVEKYSRTLDDEARLYTVYDRAGKALPTEFDRAAFGGPAERAMQTSRDARMAPTATTQQVASQVDKELGGPAARGVVEANKVALADYQKATREWQDAWMKTVPKGPWDEATRQAMLADRVARGTIPPPPTPPTMEVVPDITPDQFGAAMQVIGRAFGRAGQMDRQTHRQLAEMSKEMDTAVRDAADAAGMDVNDFLRKMRAAREFHRKEVIPMRRAAGGYSPSEVATGDATKLTPAKMYDRAVKLIEGHDMEALQKFRATLGDRGNDELVRVAAHRAISAYDESGKSVGEYIRKHDEALRVLLPRDAMEELQGIAKIADTLFDGGAKSGMSRVGRFFTHPFWAGLTFLHGATSVMHGDMSGLGSMALSGSILAFPQLRQQVINVTTKIKDASVGPLVRRAAKLKPGSPAMDDLLATIARRVERNAAVNARVTSDAAGDNPVSRTVVPMVSPSADMRPVY